MQAAPALTSTRGNGGGGGGGGGGGKHSVVDAVQHGGEETSELRGSVQNRVAYSAYKGR